MNAHELKAASDRTLQHYNLVAEDFWEGTRGHDVSQNISAMLSHVQNHARPTILDLGCGPGRDLKSLTELGCVAIGLDGSVRFVEMARAQSGCEVWQQDFLDLHLPPQRFDGVYANATLFHVPTQALPRVLLALHECLKPGGVMFTSIPHGCDQEGWNDNRYAVHHAPDTWHSYVSAAGFFELEHYYRPVGRPPEQQPWLANVWRRT